MKSSGNKRGLAALAITAAAVTMVPALSGAAFADTIDAQVQAVPGIGANDAFLYNDDGGLSVKNDGTDTTVRLEAGAGSNVREVEFFAKPQGQPTFAIGRVFRNDDGAFSYEWDPVADNVPLGSNVRIGVQGINAAGNLVGTLFLNPAPGPTLYKNNDVRAETVNLTTPDAVASTTTVQDVGYYAGSSPSCAPNQAHVALSGTTSQPAGSTLQLYRYQAQAAPVFQDESDSDPIDAGAAGTTTNTFTGVLDIATTVGGNNGNRYHLTPAPLPGDTAPVDPNQLMTEVDADPSLGSGNLTQDFDSVTLYKQAITTVTATNDDTNTSPDPANVTVKVVDQNGAPVGGVRVRAEDPAFNTSHNVGLTDGKGQVHTTLGSPSEFFFSDQQCDNGGYTPAGGDVRSNNVTVGDSTISISGPSTVAVGATATETITAKDAKGAPIANSSVRVTRNGPDVTNDIKFVDTDANGQATYQFTCNVAGTATVQASIQDPLAPPVGPFPGDPYNRSTTATITCGSATPPPSGGRQVIAAVLKAPNNGGSTDHIRVITRPVASGALVRLYKVVGSHKSVVATARVGAGGKVFFDRADTNGRAATRYFATVSATAHTHSKRTNSRGVR